MNAIVEGVAPPAAAEDQDQPFQFSGRGGEYFRIWIVNLLLTIVTLGIYSAWAKVRREQYFHRNTMLAGSAFDYHGDPVSILKGRLIVVGALVLFNLLSALSPVVAGLGGLALFMVTPWVILQSLRFRAANTSWRGVRMRFTGTVAGLLRTYFLNGLLVVVTLGLAGPWWLARFQAYLVSNLRFGGEQFSAQPRTKDYYKACLVFMAVVVGAVILLAMGAGGLAILPRGDAGNRATASVLIMVMIMGVYAGMYFFAGSYLRSRLGNALWNATRVGPHAFISTLRARELFWILLSNAFGIVCTLGLFLPAAQVRLARYRAENTLLAVDGTLDDFVAEQQAHVRALGEQAAELLDVDLAL